MRFPNVKQACNLTLPIGAALALLAVVPDAQAQGGRQSLPARISLPDGSGASLGVVHFTKQPGRALIVRPRYFVDPPTMPSLPNAEVLRVGRPSPARPLQVEGLASLRVHDLKIIEVTPAPPLMPNAEQPRRPPTRRSGFVRDGEQVSVPFSPARGLSIRRQDVEVRPEVRVLTVRHSKPSPTDYSFGDRENARGGPFELGGGRY